ncbi:MAG: cation diffusion facilitator family transporter [Fidelibacterota bacterium]
MNSITKFLLHHFIPTTDQYESSQMIRENISVRNQVGTFEGWFSAVINIIVFVVKLAIALSVNSIALLADAFHSLLDCLSSLVIIFSFKVTNKPADVEHPYGHGRAEYIATLILSMLIVVTGVEMIRSSASRVEAPAISESTPLFIIIILITVVIKEILARISGDLGQLIESDALKADAWHHRSDVFASLLAVASMILANYSLQTWDGILGIGVGIFIIWTGYSLSRDAIDTLLGKPPTPQLLENIRNTATEVNGILNAHDIIVHSYGTQRFISLHLEVDEEVSQLEAHDLAEEAMFVLERTFNANVTVHMDPTTTQGEQVEEIKHFLQGLVDANDRIDSIHDFRLVQTGEHNIILLDLAVATAVPTLEIESIKNAFSEALHERFPDFNSQINIITPIVSI